MTPIEVAAVFGAAGAVAAATLALIGVLVANIVARQLKRRELFQSSLEFLEGGTQKRSIGIAVMKHYGRDRDLKEIVTTIFQAQMLHLMDKGYDSAESARSIERFNYEEMRKTLESWGQSAPLPDGSVASKA